MVHWDRQRQRIYVGPDRRWRLHHGLAGCALAVLGGLLVWHDRRDWPWYLRDRIDR